MKTKTKPKVCADCGETSRREPSPMVIDETWRAIGCEPQTMLCDMCLSSNYGWQAGISPRDARSARQHQGRARLRWRLGDRPQELSARPRKLPRRDIGLSMVR